MRKCRVHMRNTTMDCIQLILNSQTSFEVRSMFENSPEISAGSKTWFLVENKLLATSTSSNTNAVLLKRTNDGKWRYALVETRRLGSRTKSIRRQNKKRKQTTHPEGCRRFLSSTWPLPDTLKSCPWHTMPPNPRSNFSLRFVCQVSE